MFQYYNSLLFVQYPFHFSEMCTMLLLVVVILYLYVCKLSLNWNS